MKDLLLKKMKISQLKIFLVLIFLSYTMSQNYFEWEDPETKNYYNFEILKRSYSNPWIYRKDSGAFADIYRFNFGDNVNKECYGKIGSIVESFELQNQSASSCTVLGDYRDRKINLIKKENPNEGIYLEYTGKEVCMHSFVSNQSTMRSVRFYLFCEENQEENVNFNLFVIFF